MRVQQSLALLCAWAGCTVLLHGGVIVVPSGHTSTPGPAGNTIPFSNSDYRFQQLLPGDAFPGLMTFTQLAFREGSDVKVVMNAALDVTVNLSVTQVNAGTLSTTFADNLGPVVTTVHSGSRNVALSGTLLADGTAPFEFALPFTSPFVYDPSQGNLLVEILIGTNQADSIFPGLDMIGIEVNTFGRVFGSANAVTGSSDRAGLVIQFTTADGPVGGGGGEVGTGVPEPSSVMLTAAPLAALAWARRRGRRRNGWGNS